MIGAPGRIRTHDPQIRSLVLYPAELPVLALRATLLRAIHPRGQYGVGRLRAKLGQKLAERAAKSAQRVQGPTFHAIRPLPATPPLSADGRCRARSAGRAAWPWRR